MHAEGRMELVVSHIAKCPDIPAGLKNRIILGIRNLKGALQQLVTQAVEARRKGRNQKNYTKKKAKAKVRAKAKAALRRMAAQDFMEMSASAAPRP